MYHIHIWMASNSQILSGNLQWQRTPRQCPHWPSNEHQFCTCKKIKFNVNIYLNVNSTVTKKLKRNNLFAYNSKMFKSACSVNLTTIQIKITKLRSVVQQELLQKKDLTASL